MKTIACLLTIACCLMPIASYAWDDDVASETYYKYEDYGTGLNQPGSRTNPYVTETTDRNGNTRTYETHEKVMTLPNSNESNTLYPAGSRLNPYVTERVR